MPFRHEYKQQINACDHWVLRKRLGALLQPDPFANEQGVYTIRSLYFDNFKDKALREKLDGVNRREKFRIRCYNQDDGLIRLEKKSKYNHLCEKQSAVLSREQTESLLAGDLGWMPQSNEPLVLELYSKMRAQLLKPRTLVHYQREAYIYPPGNVRITIDTDIRTGIFSTGLLEADTPLVQAGEALRILEIKYDRFLPAPVAALLQIGDRRAAAFSKYAACRLYG